MGGGGRRFNPPAKKQRKNNSFNPHKETCTRDFCLLAKTSESHVPAFNRVNDLQLAGLGKKRITFESKTMDHAGVRNKLEMVYPKLKSQGGAFEFLKAARGGKQCPLTVIPLSSKGYTIEHIKESTGAGTIIYIRPIQSNLSMTHIPINVEEGVNSECQHCHRNIPISLIRGHIANCSELAEQSKSDEDDGYLEDSDREELVFKVNSMKSINPQLSSNQTLPSTSTLSTAAKGQQEDNWKFRLQDLFPDATKQQLDECIASATSVEDAANTLADLTDIGCSELPELPLVTDIGKSSPQVKSPSNLLMFLSDFIGKTKIPGFEEITVSRDSIWLDSLKYYKRKVGDPSGLAKNLEVTFKDEEGLDGGAMRNEFFQLLMAEAQKKLFEGDEWRLVPVKDSSKLFLFRILGMIIVHVILQGGPLYTIPPLAPSIVDSLTGESKETASTSLSKHHVPLNAATEALHDLIEELDKAKTEEEIQSLLFENENKDVFWVLIGSCHWPASASINSINKNLLIQDLIYNEVVSSRREEIGEIGKGLDALGFLDYAKKHAAFIKEILCYNEFLRREFSVDDLKAVCDVAPESDREQQALDWLYSYLSQPHLTDDLPCGTRMKTLLQFWSGNKYPLAAGLSKKFQIRFLADGIGAQKLPTATACLSILRLPTVHNTEDEFSSAMTTALKFEAFGFPNP